MNIYFKIGLQKCPHLHTQTVQKKEKTLPLPRHEKSKTKPFTPKLSPIGEDKVSVETNNVASTVLAKKTPKMEAPSTQTIVAKDDKDSKVLVPLKTQTIVAKSNIEKTVLAKKAPKAECPYETIIKQRSYAVQKAFLIEMLNRTEDTPLVSFDCFRCLKHHSIKLYDRLFAEAEDDLVFFQLLFSKYASSFAFEYLMHLTKHDIEAFNIDTMPFLKDRLSAKEFQKLLLELTFHRPQEVFISLVNTRVGELFYLEDSDLIPVFEMCLSGMEEMCADAIGTVITIWNASQVKYENEQNASLVSYEISRNALQGNCKLSSPSPMNVSENPWRRKLFDQLTLRLPIEEHRYLAFPKKNAIPASEASAIQK